MSTTKTAPTPPQDVVEVGEILAAQIAELAERGIAPTPVELAWLTSACKTLHRPSGAEHVCAAGRPMPAGDAWLWPLTLQAARWWLRASDWADGEDAVYVLAYAMAHGRNADAFAHLGVAERALPAVRMWADSLACTMDELLLATAACLRQTEEEDALSGDPGAHDAGDGVDLVALLQARLGGTADHWERAVSSDYVSRALRTVVAQESAGRDGASDLQMRATANLAAVLWGIEEAHRAE